MYGMIKCVRKRNGEIQDFNLAKLQQTILVSIQEEKEFDEPFIVEKKTASRMAFEVIGDLEKKICKNEIDCMSVDPDIIQDVVEDVFYRCGYYNTAKNYMRYKYDKQLARKDKEIEFLKKQIQELQGFKERFIDDMR